ncbi:hypothetical protein EB796_002239 [Bugula neritina]|nr:hypothetical protein EB796_002239 [Bugula neritina]
MGKTLWEETLNDLIVECCAETFGVIGKKIFPWKVFKVAPTPENPEKVLEDIYQELVKTLAYVQSVAEAQGTKHLVCDEVTLADVWLLFSLQHAEVAFPQIMSLNPWVEEFMSRITSDERIKDYLSKRPKTVV